MEWNLKEANKQSVSTDALKTKSNWMEKVLSTKIIEASFQDKENSFPIAVNIMYKLN